MIKYSIFIILFIIGCEQPTVSKVKLTQETNIEVYFSPKGGCTEAIINKLKDAKKLRVQAYSFTSIPISEAVTEVYKRTKDVIVILDDGQNDKDRSDEKENKALTILRTAEVPFYFDEKHAIAHNKIMIVDDEIVITGSFNFSANAEKYNAENLLIINSKELAQKYTDNFQHHLEHSIKP